MMFETTPNTRTRDAIRKAHAERGEALTATIAWLFGRRK